MGNSPTKRIGSDIIYRQYSDIFENKELHNDIIYIRGNDQYPPFITKNDLIYFEKNNKITFNNYKKYILPNSKTENVFDAILEGIFYPLEQLCQLSNDQLNQMLTDRKIDGNSEEDLIKWQLKHQINNKSSCKTLKDAFEFYAATGFEDMNKFLREKTNGLPDNFLFALVGGKRHNIKLMFCIYQIDNLIKEANTFGDNKTVYYRGIKPPSLVVIETSMKNDKQVKKGLSKSDFKLNLNNIAFSSITTDINVAKKFVSEEDGYNCCILRFTIPRYIRVVDKSDTESNSTEMESIMERNIVYTNFSRGGKINGIYIIDCKIRKDSYSLLDIYGGRNNITDLYV